MVKLYSRNLPCRLDFRLEGCGDVADFVDSSDGRDEGLDQKIKSVLVPLHHSDSSLTLVVTCWYGCGRLDGGLLQQDQWMELSVVLQCAVAWFSFVARGVLGRPPVDRDGKMPCVCESRLSRSVVAVY
jgi:hypothetical protein